MSNLAVLGLQWGDEGKGKLIDLAAAHYDIVVRCQGGNNAGHTVQVGERVYKLSLVPSGILWPGKTAVVGNGVVINPEALLAEIQNLRDGGVRVEDNLLVSNRAHVVFSYHPLMERSSEASPGKRRIGTTSRGIGPCYEDKVARRGIRDGGDAVPGPLRQPFPCDRDRKVEGRTGIGNRRAVGHRGGSGALPRMRRAAEAIRHGHRQVPQRLGARGQAAALRGCPGDDARHRLRHLPVPDILERHGGRAMHGIGRVAPADPRHRGSQQGLCHARGGRPVRYRASRPGPGTRYGMPGASMAQ